MSLISRKKAIRFGGWYAGVTGKGRDSNPWSQTEQPDKHALWNYGWDNCDPYLKHAGQERARAAVPR